MAEMMVRAFLGGFAHKCTLFFGVLLISRTRTASVYHLLLLVSYLIHMGIVTEFTHLNW